MTLPAVRFSKNKNRMNPCPAVRGIGRYTNLYGVKNFAPLRRGMTTHASDTAIVFPQMGATTRRRAGQYPLEKPCTQLHETTPLPPLRKGGTLHSQIDVYIQMVRGESGRADNSLVMLLRDHLDQERPAHMAEVADLVDRPEVEFVDTR